MSNSLRSLWDNPRVRGEIGWVVGHKLAEYVVVFVALKLFTNLMGKEVFGEFNLVLAGIMLAINALIMPMQQTYLRHHHRAVETGRFHAAGRSVIRWFAVTTAAVAAAAALLSRPLAGPLKLETWSLLAGGLVFVGYAWRGFGIEFRDVLRERKINTLHNVGFFAAHAACVSLSVWLWPACAVHALLASALAQGAFGLLGARSFVRDVLARPSEGPSEMRQLIVRFGLPYGALLACQWVQGFGERYILGSQLDFETVGLYVAAYQVCGVPYMLMLAISRALLTPVAYQRAKDATNPRQLWSADKVLLAGIAAYVGLGAAAGLVYLLAGPPLLRLLTSADYVLPGTTLFVIAGGRFMQCLGIVVGTIFAVHHRASAWLKFQIVGAAMVLPVCWYAVDRYGLAGAAWGVFLTGSAYNLLICFAPGGYFGIVRRDRRGAADEPE